MNLLEAVTDLENDLMTTAYESGNARAFLLVIMAIYRLIKEHGPNYMTEKDLK